MHDNFSGVSGARALAWWSVATRIALNEWEPLVAVFIRDLFAGRPPAGGHLAWTTQREHHYALLSARHVLRAAALLDPPMSVDPDLAADIAAGRDLLEHWDQNQPIFNVTPRRAEPKYKSGKGFAERNPGTSPYWGRGWDARRGPLLLPNLPASAVHGLVDEAVTTALTLAPSLAPYVPERAPSPWIDDPDVHGYWPRQQE